MGLFLGELALVELEVAAVDLTGLLQPRQLRCPAVECLRQASALGGGEPAQTLLEAHLQRDIDIRVVGLGQPRQLLIDDGVVDLVGSHLVDEVLAIGRIGVNEG